MGRYSGYLLCSDIDGTLRNSSSGISAENQAAIRYFEKNGGLFTVATGRSPQYIGEYFDSFEPNTLLIGLNGTLLYDMQTHTIVCSTFLGDECAEVLDYVAGRGGPAVRVLLYSESDVYRCAGDDREGVREAFARLRGRLYKIIFCAEKDHLQNLKQELIRRFGGRYHFDRSWSEGLEMHHRQSGKGEYVRKLKEYIGDAVRTTVCVGDYENDLSMIRAADIGYAVANALPEVRQAADRVTVSNDENAIAHIIAEL